MRGSAVDLLFLPVVTLIVFLMILFPTYMGDKVTIKVMSSINDTTVDEIVEKVQTANGVMKSSWVFIVVSLYIASLISAALVRNNPIFVFVSYFFYAMAILISVIVKSVVDAIFTAQPEFITQIPFAAWYFDNLTYIIAIFGFLLILIMYNSVKVGKSEVDV